MHNRAHKSLLKFAFLLFFIAGNALLCQAGTTVKRDKEFTISIKNLFKGLKRCEGVAPVKVSEPLQPLSYCNQAGLTWESLHTLGAYPIEPIYDEIEYADFSELPREYEIWNTEINPYNVSLVDMADTVKLDVGNYCPPSRKHVTSNFGFRKWRFHYGIDLKVHKGDTVKCAFDGVVRATRYDRRGYGYFTIVRHNNGLETIYGHMSRFIAHVGDTLKAGDAIGMGGSTGRSTGYHLHFEFRYLGNPINPNDIVDFENHTVKNRVFILSAENFEYKKEIDKIRYWTIRPGDTLGRISQRTGVSISKLCSLNGITRQTILRIGRRIRYT